MNFYQYKDGYRYTSDVMFLYDFARVFRPKGSMLDVGCGCGILGLLLKRDFPSIDLTLIDIQEEHLFLADKNRNANGLEAELIAGDFANYEFNQKFDYIVSNPPFYHEFTKKSEDKRLLMSRYADFLPLKSLFVAVGKNLKPKGSFIFCYDARQLEDIFIACKEAKLRVCDICFVHPKEGREALLVLIHVKKGSNSYAKIHTPIFVFDQENYTKKAKEIFVTADSRSIDCE
ncbi:MAG: methyltransferase [Campylobacteraceae bacterium]|jgi:tRNA1(Val) A37 N6-methylase TrmN6|nr:methyltransferase [Campylobacteraceae bacterium]